MIQLVLVCKLHHEEVLHQLGGTHQKSTLLGPVAKDTPVKLKLPSVSVLSKWVEETVGGREIRQCPNVCLI